VGTWNGGMILVTGGQVGCAVGSRFSLLGHDAKAMVRGKCGFKNHSDESPDREIWDAVAVAAQSRSHAPGMNLRMRSIHVD